MAVTVIKIWRTYLVVLKVLSYCHMQIGIVFLIKSGSSFSVSIS